MKKKVVNGKISAKIAHFIKRRREQLGLTQAQLGDRLGYRYGNFIAMIEGENSAFPLQGWINYADALDVPRQEFLNLVLSEIMPEAIPYITGFREPKEKERPKNEACKSQPTLILEIKVPENLLNFISLKSENQK